ncbi:thiol:disulfide interchange protein DsbA/DsbL [Haemophilus parahaemolyticus]|uniref:thiol:disulfide interchange protein DsbA/DsbL n=1 Tax=Haemophilus parahaemolyticus TaxID=735 RepID=UPI001FB4D3C0|nr:thiol:disulfide interchange protein DsbA/DsbL [Haemophilus parahaemolyticus]
MKLRHYLTALLGLMIVLPNVASEPEKKASSEFSQKTEEKQPLFKDGKDFFSYIKPIKVDVPKGKILIQYFYQYGCKNCLTGLDSLNLYAKNHTDKILLQTSPSFAKDENFTSAMNATFKEYGKADLSPLYLFDSLDRKEEKSLLKSNEEIRAWLKRNGIDDQRFHQLFHSEPVKKQIESDVNLFKQYGSPKYVPMAVLNGKYILLQNTLYNDDYTFGVLDFLVEKLQQEQGDNDGK